MACSAIRSPLLRNQSIRHYAAASAQTATNTKADLKVLPNKVTVAAIEPNNPVAQVSVIFRAGPRDETYDIQGASHMVRFCAGLTTTRTSGFLITRNIQQLGGELTTTTDRETTCFTLKIAKNNLENAYKFFEDVVTRQEFRPWEIEDELPRLRFESSTVPVNARLIELLYKAAYRTGLGYSLYCPKRQIGHLNSETLAHFVKSNFTGPRCAVVTSGVPINEAEGFGVSLEIGTGDSQPAPSKYKGGEIRKDRVSELANVAVAVEGAGLNSINEVLSLAVLQRIAGNGSNVQYGSDHGTLTKAMCSAAKNPFAALGLNASHSDTGLFGFLLSAPAEEVGALVKVGANWLKDPKFTDDDVKRGKAGLKTTILAAGDESVPNHVNATQQVLFTGNFVSAKGIAESVDKITAADVKKVAGKIAKGKLSMSAIGNLKTVPYLDEL